MIYAVFFMVIKQLSAASITRFIAFLRSDYYFFFKVALTERRTKQNNRQTNDTIGMHSSQSQIQFNLLALYFGKLQVTLASNYFVFTITIFNPQLK